MNKRAVLGLAAVALVTLVVVIAWWLPKQRRESEFGSHEDAARALLKEHRFEDAEVHLKAALAIAETTFPRTDERLDAAVNGLADYYKERGQDSEVPPLYMRSLSNRIESKGLDDPSVADKLLDLGDAAFRDNQFDTAMVTYREALLKYEKRLGPDSLEVAKACMKVGQALQARNDWSGAEEYYARAAIIRRKLLAKNDPEIAMTIERYALVVRKLNRIAEADQLDAEAKNVRAAATAPDDDE